MRAPSYAELLAARLVRTGRVFNLDHSLNAFQPSLTVWLPEDRMAWALCRITVDDLEAIVASTRTARTAVWCTASSATTRPACSTSKATATPPGSALGPRKWRAVQLTLIDSAEHGFAKVRHSHVRLRKYAGASPHPVCHRLLEPANYHRSRRAAPA